MKIILKSYRLVCLFTFTVSVCASASILSIHALSSGAMSIDFIGRSNHAYCIQATYNLTEPVWLSLATNATDESGFGSFVDEDAVDLSKRFYRTRCVSLSDGLLAYFKFDESTGTRFDSVLTNALVENPPVVDSTNGLIGQCVVGNVSGLLSESNTYCNLDGVQRTVALWVKVDAASDDLIAGRWGGFDTLDQWRLTTANGTYELQVSDNLTPVSVNSHVAVDTNWHHLLFTYDGIETVNFWVDGAQYSTLAIIPTISSSVRFTVLSDENYLFPFFGNVDEFGVWDRVLTDDEIVRLYNSGSGVTYPFPSP